MVDGKHKDTHDKQTLATLHVLFASVDRGLHFAQFGTRMIQPTGFAAFVVSQVYHASYRTAHLLAHWG